MTDFAAPVVGAASASAKARQRARAHSRFVRVLRLGLPTLTAALVGLLGGFLVVQALHAAAARPMETPEQIRMLRPHFVGRDDQGRQYSLRAALAVRDDADTHRVRLTSPHMVLRSGSDRPKTLTADSGVYDEETRLLRLIGHVRGEDSDSSTLVSDEALVDTRAGTVTGVKPLEGVGPMGAIQAGSYGAAEKNGVVVMHGGVHAVLRSK